MSILLAERAVNTLNRLENSVKDEWQIMGNHLNFQRRIQMACHNSFRVYNGHMS